VKVTNARKDKDGKKAGETTSTHFLAEPELESVIEERIVDQRPEEVCPGLGARHSRPLTGQAHRH